MLIQSDLRKKHRPARKGHIGKGKGGYSGNILDGRGATRGEGRRLNLRRASRISKRKGAYSLRGKRSWGGEGISI